MPEKQLDQLLACLDAPEIAGDAHVRSGLCMTRNVAGPGASLRRLRGVMGTVSSARRSGAAHAQCSPCPDAPWRRLKE